MTSLHTKRPRPDPAQSSVAMKKKRKKSGPEDDVIHGPMTMEEYLRCHLLKLMKGQISVDDLVRKRKHQLSKDPPQPMEGAPSLAELQLIVGIVVQALKNPCTSTSVSFFLFSSSESRFSHCSMGC